MAEQGGDAQPAAQQQGAGWMSTLLRWAMMYYIINLFMSKWRGTGNPPPPTPQTDSEGNPIPIPIGQQPHSPLWTPNTFYNLRIYLSDQPDLFSVIDTSNNAEEDSLIFTKSHLPFSCDTTESFTQKSINLAVPPSLQNNGSYYAHIVMHQFGYPYEENDEDYDHRRVVFRTHQLTTYSKKKSTKNGMDDDAIIALWKPQLTLRPLCDWTTYNFGAIPAQFIDHFTIDSSSNKYFPVLYMDDFWLFEDKLIAVDSSVSTVPLLISVSPISQWKFKYQIQIEQQYEQQAKWAIFIKWIINKFINLMQMAGIYN